MTKARIIVRAIEGRIACIQAATILGVGDRHSRRLKERYERDGYDGLRDRGGGNPRRKRIPAHDVSPMVIDAVREHRFWLLPNAEHFFPVF
jgi:transposase